LPLSENAYVNIANIVLLTLLKYLIPKRKYVYLVICVFFILGHTACTASAVKTLLAQLQPLLDLVEILEEIHRW
jgi:hypothetical protein